MLIGRGSTDRFLDEEEVKQLVAQTFALQTVDGKRVLVIIPDGTRTAPIGMMFRVFHEALVGRVAALDYLVALGTHRPMPESALCDLVGVTAEDVKQGRYAGVNVFNHAWDDASALVQLGEISGSEIAALTGGLMTQSVAVTLNRRILEYDLLVICGPTFPHEVVGFSGGNKYFFPGISGPDVINFTHWLGAVLSSSAIIGVRDTPVRDVINRAAAMIDRPKLCFSLVVREKPQSQAGEPLNDDAHSEAGLVGLYAGTPEEAYEAAAALSARVHIRRVPRPYHRALAVMPPMYDDLWVGAKGMYKLEPAIEDGGEIVIFAPHITEVSYTHGSLLDEIGYHCRDYFLEQWPRFGHLPGGVLAHSTHLRGLGSYDPVSGKERLRIGVTLATGISRERCERLNLGYLDPASINVAEWANREDDGILLVPRAGEMLYRLDLPD